ncbi:unnamed protein product [Rhizoctonia solani]|uniref:Nephrocystin 3-like N-terminal domain-containing protein n=1 Tax=Rhizoctonia solani TaxID=456999 RepID=A0A8H2ZW43_9AGAM|nr:unnamed protein product [Rhizoctonia solani]
MELEPPVSKRKSMNETKNDGQLHSGDGRGGKRAKSPGLPPAVTSDAAISTPNSRSIAWTGLEQALQALGLATKACPPIRSAVDDLVSCLSLFEAAAKSRKDYQDMANGLKDMVHLLIPHLHGATSESIINSITGIAGAIRKEIESIGKRQERDGLRRVFSAVGDEEDLIRRYRRIDQLFRQLQGEASLNTWSISSKHFINTQLESLHPAKLARYNSELSMEVSRRTCTENTRVEILRNLIKWSEDNNAASIYWMNGMAGTGKTTIAYSVCAALEASKQLAASFFCTRTSPECRDAKRIVPTIAYQLARRSAPFRSALCKALEEDPDISTGDIRTQFNLLIEGPLLEAQRNMPNNLVVVVDALDECNDPRLVEFFLDELFHCVSELPLRFFVTSRPEPAVRHKMMLANELSRSILYLHEIEQSLVQADIELYLREELAFMAPADGDIKKLAECAGKLFIYAATAIRYVRPTGRFVNSRERLATILAVDAKAQKRLSAIDTLYSAILTAAIEDETLEVEEQNCMRLVIWTTVSACEPVLVQTLATISGIGSKDAAMVALEPLRSVLHVSENSGLVTTLHASFPDYLLTRERSGRFFCNLPTHSRLVAAQCFGIMREQLRFNIGGIQSSFIPDEKIPNIKEKIKSNISEELFYACRFWIDHLQKVTGSDHLGSAESHEILLHMMHTFLSQHLLFWMEVLNLKRCMFVCVSSMTQLHRWLSQEAKANPQLRELASDAQAFIIACRPILDYTPHIYLSTLPFAAPFGSISSYYLPRFKGLVKASGTVVEKIQHAELRVRESSSPILSAVFSPKDDFIVLGNEEGELWAQNVYDENYVFQPFIAHMEPINSVAISCDGKQIVTGSHDKTLSTWNSQNGNPVSGPFRGHKKAVISVAFSPNSAYIASGSNDNTIGIWVSQDSTIPMRQFTGHTKPVRSITFSLDGKRIVSGSSDCTVRVWDISSETAIHVLQRHTNPVALVAFSSNGTQLLSGEATSICTWNLSDHPQRGQPPKNYSSKATTLAISPEGDRVAFDSPDDFTIVVSCRSTGKLIAGPFEGHTAPIRSISFSSDGMRVISTSNDKTMRIWNVRARVQQANGTSSIPPQKPEYYDQWNLMHVKGLIHSPERTSVATRDDGRQLSHIWNLQTTTHAKISGTFLFLQFSTDDNYIFSVHGGDGSHGHTISTWDISQSKIVDGPHRCSTNGGYSSAGIACSVDGTRVVTLHGYGKVELWDVQSKRRVAWCSTGNQEAWRLETIFSLKGGKFLTSTPNVKDQPGVLKIWSVYDGKLIAGPFREITALDFSPDGSYIICRPSTGPSYNDLQMINLTNGTSISMPFNYRLTEETSLSAASLQAKFSSDSLYVTCVDGGSCYIWNIRGETVVNTALTSPDISFGSISCSHNGWCLASSTRTLRRKKVLRVGWFRFDDLKLTSVAIGVQPDGWVVDNQSRPLFWVPAEIREEFSLGNGLSVNTENGDWLCINYNNLLIGDDWSKCYIGT